MANIATSKVSAGLLLVTLFLGFGMSSAVAENYHASFTYDPATGAHSWAADYNTREGAENRALNECGLYGKNCQVVTSFENTCGAFADTRRRGGSFGWGTSGNLTEALQKAMDSCSSRAGAGNCGIIMWACTGKN